MKYFIITFCILFSYFSLFAQDDAKRKLEYWLLNYSQASELYSEIASLKESGVADSIIEIKSEEALNNIKLSIEHCEELKKDYPALKPDADFKMTQSYILGLWFYLADYSHEVFTDSIADKYLSRCFILRPNVNYIHYYALNYQVEIEDFYQSYYDQVFIRFLKAEKDGLGDTVYSSGDEYLTNLLLTFDRDFPAVIFYNSKYYFEQNRVYRILEQVPKQTILLREKLEYKLLMIEYFANFYFYQTLEDSTFQLTSEENLKIDSCELFIKKNSGEFLKIEESYLRLADAYFLLGDFEKGISYYSRGVEDASTADIRQFVDLTKSFADTSSNENFVSTCKVLINSSLDKLYIYFRENDMINESNLIYLKELYNYVGDDEKSQRIQNKLDQIAAEELAQQEKRAKREKYGFRIGIAPAKLMFGSLNQFSLMGDIKINGFEQGMRYCRYNDQVDAFRFGAWSYTGNDETSSNTYTGDEFSYWFTLDNIDDGDIEHKFCIEARYGNYRFDPVFANIVERENNTIRFYNYEVHPVGHRYDLNIVYRLTIFASNFIFLEFNISSGIGFRYLTSEFNRDSFIIDDVRYSDDRWPMITSPLRFGLRTGIRFL